MQSMLNVGIDVAKDELVIAGYPAGLVREQAIPNTQARIGRWLRTLPSGSRIAVESTGGYQRTLVELAQQAQMQVYVLHPRDVKRWAQGSGARGKTDRIDARMIADFIAKKHDRLHPYRTPSQAQRLIDELIRRRAKVVEHRTALAQTLSAMPTLARQASSALKALDALVAGIDAQIEQQLRLEPAMHAGYEHLDAIPGFGPVISSALASLFARMQFTRSDSVIAFVGIDPRPNDSGQHRGRRRITKRGPAELRRLLYIVAVSATRTKAWRPLYLRLKEQGLSGTEAAIVMARKMLRAAFAVWQSGQPFDPMKLGFYQKRVTHMGEEQAAT